MNHKYQIRPIRAEEVAEARRLIYSVALKQFAPHLSLDEATAQWDAQGILREMDDVQQNYFENGGVFLVLVDGEQMVGTGAFHSAGDGVCQLRRLYLLPAYQGRGLGYAMLMELLGRARALGYRRMRLLTDRASQSRAVDFYHRLGFVDLPDQGADEDDLWMEMAID